MGCLHDWLLGTQTYGSLCVLKGSGNFVLDPLEIILDLAHAAMIIINL